MCPRHVAQRQRGIVAIASHPRDQAGPSCPDRQSRIKREPSAAAVNGHRRYRRGMEPSLRGDSPCGCHQDEVTTPEKGLGLWVILMRYADFYW
jgi:proteasome lid subunit RPN8/RPN11